MTTTKQRPNFRIVEGGSSKKENRIIQEYLKGYTYKKMVKSNNITEKRIRKILKKNNVWENRSKKTGIIKKICFNLNISIELLFNRLANNMVSLNSFKRYYNINESTLYYYIKKHCKMSYLELICFKQGYNVQRRHLIDFEPRMIGA